MTFSAPQIIVEPFCNSGTPGTDYVIPVQTSGDNSIVTQDTGYPPLQAVPIPMGGVPVSRAQTNGVHYLYSSILMWINVGGQFTFDASVASAGGYNQNAILFDALSKKLVISLHNSNTANFVTDPTKINGTDWDFLNGAGIVQKGTSGAISWIKFSDGFIIQYGQCAINATTTFPISFVNTPRGNVTIFNNDGTNPGYIGTIILRGVTPTSITTSPVANISGTSGSIIPLFVFVGY